MKLIEIRTPDGRHIRQQHESIDAARAKLTAGYEVVGTVSLCDAEGKGGFVSPVNGPSLMTKLLEAHGDELLAWLETHGVQVVRYATAADVAA